MLKIDLHLHTVMSGHAHNTILEYINKAIELDMKIIGISDHGPASDGGLANNVYFMSLARLPREISGIRILRGIESNIINKKGEIDVTAKMEERLDYIMAGLHLRAGYNDKGNKGNTEAVLNTIRGGRIKILTHPFVTKDFKFDVKKVAEEACKNNVLLSMDTSWMTERRIYPDTLLNLKTITDIVRKNNKKIIVSSDGHNIWEMADERPLEKIKSEIGLTDNLIINNYPEELMKFLEIE